MPPRKAPLSAGQPLQRGAPLKRGGELARTTPPERKRAATGKRARNRQETLDLDPAATARAAALLRSGNWCEICRRRPATQLHHRLMRSHGGTDTPENLLAVCGLGNASGCHGLAHTHPLRYENGWLIRTGGDPSRIPVRSLSAVRSVLDLHPRRDLP